MARSSLNNNAQYAFRYLQEKYKLQPHQAAGIVGNLMQESTFNTGARNVGDGSDGSDSIGIGQWNGQRSRNFHSFAGENTRNLDTQLDFVMHELSGSGGNGGGSEARAYNNLMNSTDVAGATQAMIGYERPQGFSWKNPSAGHGYDNRLAWAGEALGMTPEQIAAAKPQPSPASDSPLMASVQAKAPSSTPENPAKPESNNGILVNAFNKLTGADYQVPSTILGAKTGDVMKGIGGIGDFAKSMMESDESINKQIQANARNSGRSSTPVELDFTPTAMLKRKRRGSLSGLGGYTLG